MRTRRRWIAVSLACCAWCVCATSVRAQDASDTPDTASAPPAVKAEEPSKRPMRVAVYDLDAPGIEPRVARLFVDSLLAELRKLQRSSVVSLDEVRALLNLEAQKQATGCTDSSCLAEIAEALGADVLVVGGFAKVGDKIALSLKRIDAQRADVTSDYTQQLEDAGGEELLAAIGPAVAKLFSDVPLRAGETRGVAPEIALRLHPPPVPLWAFATAGGVTALSAIGTAVAGLWFATSVGDLQGSFADSKSAAVPAAQVRDEQDRVKTANAVFWVAAGITGAALVVTGVMVPFTDWTGAADEGDAR